ncbi:NUDIX hydrolase [Streptococcus porcinus]
MSDFRFTKEQTVSSIRATALLVRNGQIFLTRDSNRRYYPIGGAVHIGERTEKAVSRETMEEQGIEISVKKLAFIVENHFWDEQFYWHNIEFHYMVTQLEEPNLNMREGTKVQDCEWIDINRLSEINLVPEFLKNSLPNWNGQLKHIINQ